MFDAEMELPKMGTEVSGRTLFLNSLFGRANCAESGEQMHAVFKISQGYHSRNAGFHLALQSGQGRLQHGDFVL
jgi:hypothetical protein